MLLISEEDDGFLPASIVVIDLVLPWAQFETVKRPQVTEGGRT